MTRLSFLLFVCFLLLGGDVLAQNNPVELGKVRWYRDYDQAVEISKQSKRPIFLLFQEVPGCANCTRYGTQIMSHPTLVKVIENQFVPLAIFNNKGGKDRKVLLKFSEPSWNNPVVRIIDHNGNDLVPRTGEFRSFDILKKRMIQAIELSQNEVPLALINAKAL